MGKQFKAARRLARGSWRNIRGQMRRVICLVTTLCFILTGTGLPALAGSADYDNYNRPTTGSLIQPVVVPHVNIPNVTANIQPVVSTVRVSATHITAFRIGGVRLEGKLSELSNFTRPQVNIDPDVNMSEITPDLNNIVTSGLDDIAAETVVDIPVPELPEIEAVDLSLVESNMVTSEVLDVESFDPAEDVELDVQKLLDQYGSVTGVIAAYLSGEGPDPFQNGDEFDVQDVRMEISEIAEALSVAGADPAKISQVLTNLTPEIRNQVAAQMSPENLGAALAIMDPDMAGEVLASMPTEARANLEPYLPPALQNTQPDTPPPTNSNQPPAGADPPAAGSNQPPADTDDPTSGSSDPPASPASNTYNQPPEAGYNANTNTYTENVTQEDGSTTSTTYVGTDSSGQVQNTGTYNPDGSLRESWTYGANGQAEHTVRKDFENGAYMIYHQNEAGHIISWESYNTQGQLAKTGHEQRDVSASGPDPAYLSDGNAEPGSQRTWGPSNDQLQADMEAGLTEATYADGTRASFSYHPDGSISVELTNRSQSQGEVDDEGRTQYRINAQATTLTYNPEGLLVREEFGSSGQYSYSRSSIDYSYDADGNLTSRTVTGYNTHQRYSYDPESGRLTRFENLKTGASMEYTYDDHGRITSMTDQDGTVHRVSLPPATSRNLRYTFDENGRVATAYGSGESFSYDDQGRVSVIHRADGTNINVTEWDEEGRALRGEYANYTEETWENDNGPQSRQRLDESGTVMFRYNEDGLLAAEAVNYRGRFSGGQKQDWNYYSYTESGELFEKMTMDQDNKVTRTYYRNGREIGTINSDNDLIAAEGITNADREYLINLYARQMLGRELNEKELEHWLSVAEQSPDGLKAVSEAIQQSEEFITNTVQRTYEEMLGREISDQELEVHLANARENGFDAQQFTKDIQNSPEFLNGEGFANHAQDLCQRYLRRDASKEEIALWRENVLSGAWEMSKFEEYFLKSDEYKSHGASEAAMRDIAAKYLGLEDATMENFIGFGWVDAAGNALSINTIVHAMRSSDAYLSLVLKDPENKQVEPTFYKKPKKKGLFGSIIKAIIQIVVTVVLSYVAGPLGTILAGAIFGGINAAQNGGSFFKGMLVGAAMAAATMVFSAVANAVMTAAKAAVQTGASFATTFAKTLASSWDGFVAGLKTLGEGIKNMAGMMREMISKSLSRMARVVMDETGFSQRLGKIGTALLMLGVSALASGIAEGAVNKMGLNVDHTGAVISTSFTDGFKNGFTTSLEGGLAGQYGSSGLAIVANFTRTAVTTALDEKIRESTGNVFWAAFASSMTGAAVVGAFGMVANSGMLSGKGRLVADLSGPGPGTAGDQSLGLAGDASGQAGATVPGQGNAEIDSPAPILGTGPEARESLGLGVDPESRASLSALETDQPGAPGSSQERSDQPEMIDQTAAEKEAAALQSASERSNNETSPERLQALATNNGRSSETSSESGSEYSTQPGMQDLGSTPRTSTESPAGSRQETTQPSVQQKEGTQEPQPIADAPESAPEQAPKTDSPYATDPGNQGLVGKDGKSVAELTQQAPELTEAGEVPQDMVEAAATGKDGTGQPTLEEKIPALPAPEAERQTAEAGVEGEARADLTKEGVERRDGDVPVSDTEVSAGAGAGGGAEGGAGEGGGGEGETSETVGPEMTEQAKTQAKAGHSTSWLQDAGRSLFGTSISKMVTDSFTSAVQSTFERMAARAFVQHAFDAGAMAEEQGITKGELEAQLEDTMMTAVQSYMSTDANMVRAWQSFKQMFSYGSHQYFDASGEKVIETNKFGDKTLQYENGQIGFEPAGQNIRLLIDPAGRMQYINTQTNQIMGEVPKSRIPAVQQQLSVMAAGFANAGQMDLAASTNLALFNLTQNQSYLTQAATQSGLSNNVQVSSQVKLTQMAQSIADLDVVQSLSNDMMTDLSGSGIAEDAKGELALALADTLGQAGPAQSKALQKDLTRALNSAESSFRKSGNRAGLARTADRYARQGQTARADRIVDTLAKSAKQLATSRERLQLAQTMANLPLAKAKLAAKEIVTQDLADISEKLTASERLSAGMILQAAGADEETIRSVQQSIRPADLQKTEKFAYSLLSAQVAEGDEKATRYTDAVQAASTDQERIAVLDAVSNEAAGEWQVQAAEQVLQGVSNSAGLVMDLAQRAVSLREQNPALSQTFAVNAATRIEALASQAKTSAPEQYAQVAELAAATMEIAYQTSGDIRFLDRMSAYAAESGRAELMLSAAKYDGALGRVNEAVSNVERALTASSALDADAQVTVSLTAAQLLEQLGQQGQPAFTQAMSTLEQYMKKQTAELPAQERAGEGFHGGQTESALVKALQLMFDSRGNLLEMGGAGPGAIGEMVKFTVNNLFQNMSSQHMQVFFAYFGHDTKSAVPALATLESAILAWGEQVKGSTHEAAWAKTQAAFEQIANGQGVEIQVDGETVTINNLQVVQVTQADWEVGADPEHLAEVGAFFKVEGETGIIYVMPGTGVSTAVMHEFAEFVAGHSHETVQAMQDFAAVPEPAPVVTAGIPAVTDTQAPAFDPQMVLALKLSLHNPMQQPLTQRIAMVLADQVVAATNGYALEEPKQWAEGNSIINAAGGSYQLQQLVGEQVVSVFFTPDAEGQLAMQQMSVADPKTGAIQQWYGATARGLELLADTQAVTVELPDGTQKVENMLLPSRANPDYQATKTTLLNYDGQVLEMIIDLETQIAQTEKIFEPESSATPFAAQDAAPVVTWDGQQLTETTSQGQAALNELSRVSAGALIQAGFIDTHAQRLADQLEGQVAYQAQDGTIYVSEDLAGFQQGNYQVLGTNAFAEGLTSGYLAAYAEGKIVSAELGDGKALTFAQPGDTANFTVTQVNQDGQRISRTVYENGTLLGSTLEVKNFNVTLTYDTSGDLTQESLTQVLAGGDGYQVQATGQGFALANDQGETAFFTATGRAILPAEAGKAGGEPVLMEYDVTQRLEYTFAQIDNPAGVRVAVDNITKHSVMVQSDGQGGFSKIDTASTLLGEVTVQDTSVRVVDAKTKQPVWVWAQSKKLAKATAADVANKIAPKVGADIVLSSTKKDVWMAEGKEQIEGGEKGLYQQTENGLVWFSDQKTYRLTEADVSKDGDWQGHQVDEEVILTADNQDRPEWIAQGKEKIKDGELGLYRETDEGLVWVADQREYKLTEEDVQNDWQGHQVGETVILTADNREKPVWTTRGTAKAGGDVGFYEKTEAGLVWVAEQKTYKLTWADVSGRGDWRGRDVGEEVILFTDNREEPAWMTRSHAQIQDGEIGLYQETARGLTWVADQKTYKLTEQDVQAGGDWEGHELGKEVILTADNRKNPAWNAQGINQLEEGHWGVYQETEKGLTWVADQKTYKLTEQDVQAGGDWEGHDLGEEVILTADDRKKPAWITRGHAQTEDGETGFYQETAGSLVWTADQMTYTLTQEDIQGDWQGHQAGERVTLTADNRKDPSWVAQGDAKIGGDNGIYEKTDTGLNWIADQKTFVINEKTGETGTFARNSEQGAWTRQFMAKEQAGGIIVQEWDAKAGAAKNIAYKLNITAAEQKVTLVMEGGQFDQRGGWKTMASEATLTQVETLVSAFLTDELWVNEVPGQGYIDFGERLSVALGVKDGDLALTGFLDSGAQVTITKAKRRWIAQFQGDILVDTQNAGLITVEATGVVDLKTGEDLGTHINPKNEDALNQFFAYMGIATGQNKDEWVAQFKKSGKGGWNIYNTVSHRVNKTVNTLGFWTGLGTVANRAAAQFNDKVLNNQEAVLARAMVERALEGVFHEKVESVKASLTHWGEGHWLSASTAKLGRMGISALVGIREGKRFPYMFITRPWETARGFMDVKGFFMQFINDPLEQLAFFAGMGMGARSSGLLKQIPKSLRIRGLVAASEMRAMLFSPARLARMAGRVTVTYAKQQAFSFASMGITFGGAALFGNLAGWLGDSLGFSAGVVEGMEGTAAMFGNFGGAGLVKGFMQARQDVVTKQMTTGKKWYITKKSLKGFKRGTYETPFEMLDRALNIRDFAAAYYEAKVDKLAKKAAGGQKAFTQLDLQIKQAVNLELVKHSATKLQIIKTYYEISKTKGTPGEIAQAMTKILKKPVTLQLSEPAPKSNAAEATAGRGPPSAADKLSQIPKVSSKAVPPVFKEALRKIQQSADLSTAKSSTQSVLATKEAINTLAQGLSLGGDAALGILQGLNAPMMEIVVSRTTKAAINSMLDKKPSAINDILTTLAQKSPLAVSQVMSQLNSRTAKKVLLETTKKTVGELDVLNQMPARVFNRAVSKLSAKEQVRLVEKQGAPAVVERLTGKTLAKVMDTLIKADMKEILTQIAKSANVAELSGKAGSLKPGTDAIATQSKQVEEALAKTSKQFEIGRSQDMNKIMELKKRVESKVQQENKLSAKTATREVTKLLVLKENMTKLREVFTEAQHLHARLQQQGVTGKEIKISAKAMKKAGKTAVRAEKLYQAKLSKLNLDANDVLNLQKYEKALGQADLNQSIEHAWKDHYEAVYQDALKNGQLKKYNQMREKFDPQIRAALDSVTAKDIVQKRGTAFYEKYMALRDNLISRGELKAGSTAEAQLLEGYMKYVVQKVTGYSDLYLSQKIMVSEFLMGNNAGLRPSGGKTLAFIMFSGMMRMLKIDSLRAELLVDDPSAIDKYLHEGFSKTKKMYGVELTHMDLAKAMGIKLEDGNALYQKGLQNSNGKFEALVSALNDKNTAVVFDYTTRAQLRNSAIHNMDLALALKSTNQVGIDEAHIPATTQTSAIHGGNVSKAQKVVVEAADSILKTLGFNQAEFGRVFKTFENKQAAQLGGFNIVRYKTLDKKTVSDVNLNKSKTIVVTNDGVFLNRAASRALKGFNGGDVSATIRALFSQAGMTNQLFPHSIGKDGYIYPVDALGEIQFNQISNDIVGQVVIARKAGKNPYKSVRVNETTMETPLSAMYAGNQAHIVGASGTMAGLDSLMKARIGSGVRHISTSLLDLQSYIFNTGGKILTSSTQADKVVVDSILRVKRNALVFEANPVKQIEQVVAHMRALLKGAQRGQLKGFPVLSLISPNRTGYFVSPDKAAGLLKLLNAGRDKPVSTKVGNSEAVDPSIKGLKFIEITDAGIQTIVENTGKIKNQICVINGRAATGKNYPAHLTLMARDAQALPAPILTQLVLRSGRLGGPKGKWLTSRYLLVDPRDTRATLESIKNPATQAELTQIWNKDPNNAGLTKNLKTMDPAKINFKNQSELSQVIKINSEFQQTKMVGDASRFAVQNTTRNMLLIEPLKETMRTGTGVVYNIADTVLKQALKHDHTQADLTLRLPSTASSSAVNQQYVFNTFQSNIKQARGAWGFRGMLGKALSPQNFFLGGYRLVIPSLQMYTSLWKAQITAPRAKPVLGAGLTFADVKPGEYTKLYQVGQNLMQGVLSKDPGSIEAGLLQGAAVDIRQTIASNKTPSGAENQAFKQAYQQSRNYLGKKGFDSVALSTIAANLGVDQNTARYAAARTYAEARSLLQADLFSQLPAESPAVPEFGETISPDTLVNQSALTSLAGTDWLGARLRRSPFLGNTLLNYDMKAADTQQAVSRLRETTANFTSPEWQQSNPELVAQYQGTYGENWVSSALEETFGEDLPFLQAYDQAKLPLQRTFMLAGRPLQKQIMTAEMPAVQPVIASPNQDRSKPAAPDIELGPLPQISEKTVVAEPGTVQTTASEPVVAGEPEPGLPSVPMELTTDTTALPEMTKPTRQFEAKPEHVALGLAENVGDPVTVMPEQAVLPRPVMKEMAPPVDESVPGQKLPVRSVKAEPVTQEPEIALGLPKMGGEQGVYRPTTQGDFVYTGDIRKTKAPAGVEELGIPIDPQGNITLYTEKPTAIPQPAKALPATDETIAAETLPVRSDTPAALQEDVETPWMARGVGTFPGSAYREYALTEEGFVPTYEVRYKPATQKEVELGIAPFAGARVTQKAEVPHVAIQRESLAGPVDPVMVAEELPSRPDVPRTQPAVEGIQWTMPGPPEHPEADYAVFLETEQGPVRKYNARNEIATKQHVALNIARRPGELITKQTGEYLPVQMPDRPASPGETVVQVETLPTRSDTPATQIREDGLAWYYESLPELSPDQATTELYWDTPAGLQKFATKQQILAGPEHEKLGLTDRPGVPLTVLAKKETIILPDPEQKPESADEFILGEVPTTERKSVEAAPVMAEDQWIAPGDSRMKVPGSVGLYGVSATEITYLGEEKHTLYKQPSSFDLDAPILQPVTLRAGKLTVSLPQDRKLSPQEDFTPVAMSARPAAPVALKPGDEPAWIAPGPAQAGGTQGVYLQTRGGLEWMTDIMPAPRTKQSLVPGQPGINWQPQQLRTVPKTDVLWLATKELPEVRGVETAEIPAPKTEPVATPAEQTDYLWITEGPAIESAQSPETPIPDQDLFAFYQHTLEQGYTWLANVKTRLLTAGEQKTLDHPTSQPATFMSYNQADPQWYTTGPAREGGQTGLYLETASGLQWARDLAYEVTPPTLLDVNLTQLPSVPTRAAPAWQLANVGPLTRVQNQVKQVARAMGKALVQPIDNVIETMRIEMNPALPALGLTMGLAVGLTGLVGFSPVVLMPVAMIGALWIQHLTAQPSRLPVVTQITHQASTLPGRSPTTYLRPGGTILQQWLQAVGEDHSGQAAVQSLVDIWTSGDFGTGKSLAVAPEATQRGFMHLLATVLSFMPQSVLQSEALSNIRFGPSTGREDVIIHDLGQFFNNTIEKSLVRQTARIAERVLWPEKSPARAKLQKQLQELAKSEPRLKDAAPANLLTAYVEAYIQDGEGLRVYITDLAKSTDPAERKTAVLAEAIWEKVRQAFDGRAFSVSDLDEFAEALSALEVAAADLAARHDETAAKELRAILAVQFEEMVGLPLVEYQRAHRPLLGLRLLRRLAAADWLRAKPMETLRDVVQRGYALTAMAGLLTLGAFGLAAAPVMIIAGGSIMLVLLAGTVLMHLQSKDILWALAPGFRMESALAAKRLPGGTPQAKAEFRAQLLSPRAQQGLARLQLPGGRGLINESARNQIMDEFFRVAVATADPDNGLSREVKQDRLRFIFEDLMAALRVPMKVKLAFNPDGELSVQVTPTHQPSYSFLTDPRLDRTRRTLESFGIMLNIRYLLPNKPIKQKATDSSA